MNNRSYNYALSIISPILSVLLLLLYYSGISTLSFTSTIIISSLLLLCCVLGILSFISKKVLYIIPFVFQVMLFVSNLQNGVIITVLYLFPIALAFYVRNTKYITCSIIFNILSYIISNIIKYRDVEGCVVGCCLEGLIYGGQVAIIIISLLSYVKYLKKINFELDKVNRKSLSTQKDMINFCINSLSYHSPYLRIHTKNVAYYSKLILSKMKTTKKFKDDCYLGALVHDIGKIYISDSILDKPSKLTDEEYKLIKSHVAKGVELFSTIPYNAINRETFDICINCIKYHHERLDGYGYDLNLKDNEIPTESRIIAIADTMDALLSYRSYKEPKSFEQTISILRDEKLFDQKLVDIVESLKDEIISYSEKSNNELKSLFKK